MKFEGDYLLYKFKTAGPPYTDTLYLPTVAKNGLILMDNGNIHMQGT